MAEADHWTLDKRIPLAFIFSILMQTCVGVWWASDISSQQTFMRANDARQDERIEALRNDTVSNDRITVRLIEQIEQMRRATDELKVAQLDTNALLRELFQSRNQP